LLGDSPTEIADAVVSLNYGTALWFDLTANALRLVQQKYDWVAIGEKLSAIYADLLVGARQSSAVGVSGRSSQS
jgi:CelD/BcsL family acetyltransferase involved in cellulose biosynthesis